MSLRNTRLNLLTEDEPEKYQTHFSEYIKKGIEADGLEELYKKVHAAILVVPHICTLGVKPIQRGLLEYITNEQVLVEFL